MQPYIAHLDLDSFFVSVELLNQPHLKGKPVIVGGANLKGVVTTCSYEARAFGVHSAMPMAKAIRLCPQAIVLQSSRGEYSRYSKWVTQIIADKAPLFEKASIDEFYIDLTGMDKFFEPYSWTKNLCREISDTTGLPISFGLASNKMVAKIATDMAKPNGSLFITPGQEQAFLHPLPVNKISGIGKQTNQKLLQLGIVNIGDILNYSPSQLQQQLGILGTELHQKALGIHHGVVTPWHEAKSISTENTFFEAITDVDFLHNELIKMTEKVAFQLRKTKCVTACIAVKIRYSNFSNNTKQMSIAATALDNELIPHALMLLHKILENSTMPVRLMGVRLSQLTKDHLIQADIFNQNQKNMKLFQAIDEVKNKFGKVAIQRGSSLKK